MFETARLQWQWQWQWWWFIWLTLQDQQCYVYVNTILSFCILRLQYIIYFLFLCSCRCLLQICIFALLLSLSSPCYCLVPHWVFVWFSPCRWSLWNCWHEGCTYLQTVSLLSPSLVCYSLVKHVVHFLWCYSNGRHQFMCRSDVTEYYTLLVDKSAPDILTSLLLATIILCLLQNGYHSIYGEI